MLQLIIGNPNYSSWSMRGWLCLRLAELPFEETVVQLGNVNWQDEVRAMGGEAGKVPVLIDDGLAIWDTMAIAEYCHERTGRIWPESERNRTRARSLAAEMHSGFTAIRSTMPCNVRARDREPLTDDRLDPEIQRVAEIWSGAEGQFLFGDFCGADAFFAPIASRFRTYGVVLSARAALYQSALLAHPLVIAWSELGAAEPRVEQYERPERVRAKQA